MSGERSALVEDSNGIGRLYGRLRADLSIRDGSLAEEHLHAAIDKVLAVGAGDIEAAILKEFRRLATDSKVKRSKRKRIEYADYLQAKSEETQ